MAGGTLVLLCVRSTWVLLCVPEYFGTFVKARGTSVLLCGHGYFGTVVCP